MPKRKIKLGDTFLVRMRVSRISEDGDHITLKSSLFSTPNTVLVYSLEDDDDVIDEQAVGKK